MDFDNLSMQVDEVEALSSIYGDDFKIENDVTKSYCVKIEERKRRILLHVTMTPDYPSVSPPNYKITAPWMEKRIKDRLYHVLDEIYLEHESVIIFQWVEKIREVLLSRKVQDKNKLGKNLKKPLHFSHKYNTQAEEVEALSSIYGDDWIIESDRTKSYCIKVVDKKREILLYVTMPPDYPSLSPPKYELSAPWMERKAKEQLHNTLEEVYLDNIGETVVYQWVEKIREVLQSIKSPEEKKKPIVVEESIDMSKLEINCPAITHGEVIVDRKSSFQGHAAEVHSIEDVKAVLAKLKQNKKISNATHNMYAYRIERGTARGPAALQDCDDDGEAHAGARMLHLLQILDQRNTLVVVSRWYGGIQLGPDRFRHINNATRQAIEQAGLLKK